jgi:hypothetical protein
MTPITSAVIATYVAWQPLSLIRSTVAISQTPSEEFLERSQMSKSCIIALTLRAMNLAIQTHALQRELEAVEYRERSLSRGTAR